MTDRAEERKRKIMKPVFGPVENWPYGLANSIDSAVHEAVDAERHACSVAAAIHSQYPITTDYDRGYDKARKDAAAAIRSRRDKEG